MILSSSSKITFDKKIPIVSTKKEKKKFYIMSFSVEDQFLKYITLHLGDVLNKLFGGEFNR